MRIALDTNILAYAEGVNGTAMQQRALDLIDRLPADDVFVSVQVLGELFNVLTRKASRPRDLARTLILSWRDTFSVLNTTAPLLLAAIDLAADHHLRIWDSLILSTAAHAGCQLLLSEDLHEGFTWGGVTVTNPFASPRHPLLNTLLVGPLQ